MPLPHLRSVTFRGHNGNTPQLLAEKSARIFASAKRHARATACLPVPSRMFQAEMIHAGKLPLDNDAQNAQVRTSLEGSGPGFSAP
jgi:hypothetical protein